MVKPLELIFAHTAIGKKYHLSHIGVVYQIADTWHIMASRKRKYLKITHLIAFALFNHQRTGIPRPLQSIPPVMPTCEIHYLPCLNIFGVVVVGVRYHTPYNLSQIEIQRFLDFLETDSSFYNKAFRTIIKYIAITRTTRT